jgi:hypothetical protein
MHAAILFFFFLLLLIVLLTIAGEKPFSSDPAG